MNTSFRNVEFKKSVENKFNVYNSLFLNMPFSTTQNVGALIPLMNRICSEGLAAGQDPAATLESFFHSYAGVGSEEERIALIFMIIRYVERQVVLFDSIEEAAYVRMQQNSNDLTLSEFIHASTPEDREIISEKLRDFSARLVLTAHPTQFYPPAVLEIISRLRVLVDRNDINQIDQTLQQLGFTSLLNRVKPTPFDEARNIIYYLRNVYYPAIGELYQYIRKVVPDNSFDNPDIIRLGFWAGGDRDGNPFVTAATTRDVADELRMTLMKCYYNDVKELASLLTFPGVDEIMRQLQETLYQAMFNRDQQVDHQQLLDSLARIRVTLTEQYNAIYRDELDCLMDKIRIFRKHFAVLDIRQDHNTHKTIVEEILRANGLLNGPLDDLTEEVLIRLLLTDGITVCTDSFEDGVAKDTLITMLQLRDIQERNGEEGCCRYIISNSEDIFGVLFVFALLRWCHPALPVSFDIIPLFETMAGMEAAERVMRRLFTIPEYRAHVASRGDDQTIMLGFSDGTKDGGYLKANWSIFRSKEVLSGVCREYGIRPVFFDGRGGPPARGGGKTQRFYAAQSSLIANHEIQLTIQGQTITSMYGTREQFSHNIELLLTAGLTNCFPARQNVIRDDCRRVIEELADTSYRKYIALKEHPLFVPYLENRSPLKYYGKANIGSRPAKRSKGTKLELKDLRAIPFVGAWSQLKQNVPGYYGIGTALKAMADAGRFDEVKHAYESVPFFKALILNSMMSLLKCNFNLTRYLANDPEYGEFWKMLNDEYELSVAMTLQLADFETLMQEEPVTRNSVEIREQIMLPLLVIQQYALQKSGIGSDQNDAYGKIIERSMYGIINASRNSA